MKEYLFKNYSSMSELEKDMIIGLNEDFADLEVKSNTYTDCEICEVTDFCLGPNNIHDVHVELSSKSGFHTMLFRAAVKCGSIILDEKHNKLLNDYFNAYDLAEKERITQIKKDIEVYAKEHEEERRIELARQRETIRKRDEEELIKKIEAKKRNAREKFDRLLCEAKRSNLDINDEDTIIGWLAKHSTNISAEIPDFLKDNFIKQFGSSAPVTVVNTETKSIGGFIKKWAFSGSITIDSLDTIPPILNLKFKNHKKLNDSKFILNLIYNYGFKFGKTQNVDEIKQNISNEDAFNLGFNA